jgi:predicted Zn-dependent protease
MGAMCLALALSLIIVVKEFLASPVSPTAANGATAHATARPGAPGTDPADALAQARAAMNARDFPRAAAIVQRAIEADPMDQDLRLALAEALVAQDLFADAYAQYEKAIVIGGSAAARSARLQFMAGTVAFKAGLIDRAEEHYHLAQTAAPTDPEIPLYLAMAQVRLRKTQAAVGSLLRVVHLQPDRAEAWGTLAEIYFTDDKPDLAMQHLEKARTLQPASARWRILEARILNRQNQPRQAATTLLALDPAQRRRPEVLKVLAESYGMLGRPADAAALYADAAAAAAESPADDGAASSDGRAAPPRPDAAASPAALNYEAALWFERARDTESAVRHARAAAALGSDDALHLLQRLTTDAAVRK